MMIATAQMAYPNYDAAVWHIYLVYVAMMFISYVIICLPTRYVSWFNIWASGLGIVILLVMTVVLPVKAEQLNSGKAIFTSVSDLERHIHSARTDPCLINCSSITKSAGLQDGRSA